MELFTATPDDDYETKARALRSLARAWRPRKVTLESGRSTFNWKHQRKARAVVRAEYERLFGEPSAGGTLELILKDQWSELRALAGQKPHPFFKRWVHADGSMVGYDEMLPMERSVFGDC